MHNWGNFDLPKRMPEDHISLMPASCLSLINTHQGTRNKLLVTGKPVRNLWTLTNWNGLYIVIWGAQTDMATHREYPGREWSCVSTAWEAWVQTWFACQACWFSARVGFYACPCLACSACRFWSCVCWESLGLSKVCYHLPKFSGKTGWKVNGTRLFGSFSRKFPGTTEHLKR